MPGPGHYNSNNLHLLKKSPGYIFPSSKKDTFIKKSNGPGIGQYNVENFWTNKNKTGYTMYKSKRFKSADVIFIRKVKPSLDLNLTMENHSKYLLKLV